MRYASIFAALAVSLSACATPREEQAPARMAAASAPAAAACQPPPKQLVKRDLEPGKGPTVGLRTGVNVFYTGWLYDGCKPELKGEKFDSNAGTSVPFPLLVGVGKVIQGWDEGLLGMKEGGKRLLVIPPDKAYGAREVAGGKIPAHSTLVFEVHVIQVAYQPPENK